jgi:hypothetical protein
MDLILLGSFAIAFCFALSLFALSYKKIGRLERGFCLLMCFLGEVAGVYGVAYGVVVMERLQAMAY